MISKLEYGNLLVPLYIFCALGLVYAYFYIFVLNTQTILLKLINVYELFKVVNLKGNLKILNYV